MHLFWEKRALFCLILLFIGSSLAAGQKLAGRGEISFGTPEPAALNSSLPNAPPSFVPFSEAVKAEKPGRAEGKNEFSQINLKPATKPAEYLFRNLPAIEKPAAFGDRQPSKAPVSARPTEDPDDADPLPANEGFNYRGAFGQSLLFLGVQHGFAALSQEKTRKALKGKFWDDYIDSVKSLHGWGDGGRFFTNYVAHPMQGSFTGFIYVQNSPQARRQQFGATGDYWRSRLKAMLWTAAWSTQFEIGPISQASIGNVGLKGKQTWEDIVVTPTLGTAMLVTEDALDRYLIKSIERRYDNFYIKIFSRMLFNPTRNFSNMLRFKAPWHRDRPVAH